MTKNVWWENINDISEEDVLGLVKLYNSFISYNGNDDLEKMKYYIKYNSKNFRKHKHYGDAIKLHRFMARLSLRPREYLNVQFEYYRKEKKHPYCRPFPSLKHLSSPAALARWKVWLLDTRKIELPSTSLSSEDLMAYGEGYLKDLLISWDLPNETALFKDIVLARNFELDFLQKRDTFMGLVAEKYYEQTYNVKNYKELFV